MSYENFGAIRMRKSWNNGLGVGWVERGGFGLSTDVRFVDRRSKLEWISGIEKSESINGIEVLVFDFW
jgi:hypothetical protein